MLAPGVVEAFRIQAQWCRQFGAPLYAELSERAAEDIERGGPLARLLDGWTGNPLPDALVMRLFGAVHDLVLSGAAPELARFYPSVGGTPVWPQTWGAFLRTVAAHEDRIRPRLDAQVQTNETSRCAPLLGGFLEVAASTGVPLRLLEIGTSAGLNLLWDRYRYAFARGGAATEGGAEPLCWGDPASPVVIRAEWDGATRILAGQAAVAERAGCDLAPVDVADADAVRLLESFVWPDQLDRLAQLRAAIDVARRVPRAIERRAAADWLAGQLAGRRDGVATVVFHSVMWWYLSEDERQRVSELIAAAGRRATSRAPVAWLRMELMTAQDPEIRLQQWPGGADRLLAYTHFHGREVRWVAG